MAAFKRQQIGLFGDLLDHVGDAADFSGARRQLPDLSDDRATIAETFSISSAEA
jgi:hypothetical protein